MRQSYISTPSDCLPSSLPPCCTQTCLSEEVREGGEEGVSASTPQCQYSLVPATGPPVYPGHSQGGAGVLRVCTVQWWKQQQRPKYNSPEALLLLLLPRGSCQPGGGGAQPRFGGPRPQPDLNLVLARASTALTEPPPQLEPPKAKQPAQPGDSHAIIF